MRIHIPVHCRMGKELPTSHLSGTIPNSAAPFLNCCLRPELASNEGNCNAAISKRVILIRQRSFCAREARFAEIEAVRRPQISATNSPSSNGPDGSHYRALESSLNPHREFPPCLPDSCPVYPKFILLASSGEDWIVRLWHISTGQEQAALQGHNGPVWCVDFAPDGRTLASASEDGTIGL